VDDKITFRAMQTAFAEAEEAHRDRVHESAYVLADLGVRMRIVGRHLAACIHLPFAHLQTGEAQPLPPRLTIELWDGSETDISLPAGRNSGSWTSETGSSWSDDGRFFTNFTHTSVTCLDRSVGHVVGYARDAQRLSLYERGRPLHVPLTIWHNDRNVPIIHSGLVARNGHGVLLAGSRGAGKSTAAVTCLCAGYGFLSDDLIGLQCLGDDSFVGHSVYGSTYLEASDLQRFPPLGPHSLSSSYSFEDKQLVLLSQVFPLRLECSAPIKAVALAAVADRQHTQIRPATKAEALLALAPSSLIVGNISSGRRGFDKLARLVAQVPCYWLELGRDRTEIPGRVEELLSAALS